MRYVQYYWRHGDKMIEECGDRGVVVLDARNSIETSMDDAVNFNGKHRPFYAGCRIFQGGSFSNARPITELINL
jgi:hypothetical protein